MHDSLSSLAGYCPSTIWVTSEQLAAGWLRFHPGTVDPVRRHQFTVLRRDERGNALVIDPACNVISLRTER